MVRELSLICTHDSPTEHDTVRIVRAEAEHNKSLQLSPKGLSGALYQVPNSIKDWSGAAAQLNSMLDSILGQFYVFLESKWLYWAQHAIAFSTCGVQILVLGKPRACE